MGLRGNVRGKNDYSGVFQCFSWSFSFFYVLLQPWCYFAASTSRFAVTISFVDSLVAVYDSWIMRKIDDYNCSMYYENTSYQYASLVAGHALWCLFRFNNQILAEIKFSAFFVIFQCPFLIAFRYVYSNIKHLEDEKNNVFISSACLYHCKFRT